MTNYNDGKWHRWHGEDMKPSSVHDMSIVEFIWHDENTGDTGKFQMKAGWDDMDERPAWSNILKFRVIKEHRAPREMWVCIYDGTAWDGKEQAEKFNRERGPILHMKEVQ